MTNRTTVFKTIAFCFLSLSSFQLCAAEGKGSDAADETNIRATAFRNAVSLLDMQIMFAKATKYANHMMISLGESHEGMEKEEIEKMNSELELRIAQLIKQHSTLVAAEQTMQCIQQAIDAKKADSSFKPSSEEAKRLKADLAETRKALQALLPEEEKGETEARVDLLLLKPTKKSD